LPGGTKLLVSDSNANCVHILDTLTFRRPADLASANESRIGPELAGPHGATLSLNGPHGLAVSPHDAKAHVYICDRYNHRVLVTTGSGECVRVLGGPLSADASKAERGRRVPGRFSEPVDVAVGRARLYVAEYGNRRVQVLALEGDPLQLLSLPGNKAPRGLALSREAAFGAVAQRLWVSADQSGIHVVAVGAAALSPP